MKPKFKRIVDAGDLVGTRLFLANEMMLDPRGKSFSEMRSYAENSFTNLYEMHDGTSFELDREKWDENLLNAVRNDLDYNFSRERLDYYCDVAKVVLKEKVASLDAEEKEIAQRNQAYSNNRNGSDSNSKENVYKSITIGGAVLAVTGLFIEKTAVACAVSSLGVIGMAVGGYLLYNEKKNG
jgi:hypothetical protein